MVRPLSVGLALVTAAFLASVSAFGQNPATPPPAGAPAPAAPAAAPGASVAPAAPAAPVREATGYAPSDPPRREKRGVTGGRGKTPKKGVVRQPKTGGFVIEPGFETLADGGSRFFVELGQAVPVEERKAKGTVTYVLKGAFNPKRNNFNPLVTEHFNTPVRRAKLAPAGHDLIFVLEMRQDSPATHRMASTKEGHAVLQVDFGAGAFIKEEKPLPPPQDQGGDQQDDNAALPQNPANLSETRGKGPKP